MTERRLAGVPLAYYISGRENGEWAMLLHAAFADHTMFDRQIAELGARCNILSVDIIGHGASVPAGPGEGVADMSPWLRTVLDGEGIERVHAVGVSLGGVLAQDFADRFPERVRSLACFGAYDINCFDAKRQRKNSGGQLLMMLRAMLSTRWFARANREIAAYSERAKAEFYAMNMRFPKRSFACLASLGRMVNRRKTGERGYPLLIGCGEHDLPDEFELIKEWEKREPRCRSIVFEGAGHCVNLDAPEAFNTALLHFWQSAAEGSGGAARP